MIRDRFVQTRRAVVELETVRALIASEGEDWRPPSPHAPGVGDPTAAKAIKRLDEWGAKLEALKERERELDSFVRTTVAIIAHVREGLGSDYAELLEQRYIECLEWSDVTVGGYRISRFSGRRRLNIAFDWIDALGLARLLSGDYEL